MMDMRILFVCTGNIHRSPMAELLAPGIFRNSSLEFASAGTRGLHGHAIGEEAAALLRRDHVDEHAIKSFRSRRITPQIAAEADLILCFEAQQRGDIVIESPMRGRRTFMLTDFANIAEASKANGWLAGDTMAERIDSVIDSAGLLRPELPEAQDVDDPQGMGEEAFTSARDAIVQLLDRIARALQ